MRKIPTVFRRDPDNMSRVLPEVTPGCEWVFAGEGHATRKYDGTCVMLDEQGDWWARREVKPGKTPPNGFVPADYDETTGKTVGWEPMGQSSFAKFHAEALDNWWPTFDMDAPRAGTYELCGPKINGNPEGFPSHVLVEHSQAERLPELDEPFSYAELLVTMRGLGWEGLVWHHPDRRMAKLKARDFGSSR